MARPKPECGTYPAYMGHVRRKEPVDAACRQAANDQKNERVRTATEDLIQRQEEAAAQEPEVNLKELKDLDEALENLRLVRAAMKAAPPNAIANLSKRRQELTAYIVQLRDTLSEGRTDPVDDIAARRAARSAVS